MSSDRARPIPLPDSVNTTLDEFRKHLHLDARIRASTPDGESVLYAGLVDTDFADCWTADLNGRKGQVLQIDLVSLNEEPAGRYGELVRGAVERALEFGQEIRFFTHELSERYEEINLLYSISETLGSILRLDDATEAILEELCDVLGARRGSLWVHDPDHEQLTLTASFGDEGLRGPLSIADPQAVTARVFREGRPMIASQGMLKVGTLGGVPLDASDTFLSVPIRYTPPTGESRTVGVINLIGRRHGGVFTAADQKLLAAIASQIGAALENNRLIRQSFARERMASEMELAHNLQQKLLPSVDKFEGARVAARVEPAEQVGGDFYQVIKLQEGRIGVMIADVSGHGFPAALMMASGMSAATIYAAEFGNPAKVLRQMDDALKEELENTEMYLTMVYCVLDKNAGTLTYSNAGHPHAFLVSAEGEATRLKATDPPVGFAGPASYEEVSMPWNAASDLLFLFTDGLSDTLTTAETPNGEAFVIEQIIAERNRSPAEIIAHLFDLARVAVPSIPSDDRTAIVLAGE